MTQIPAIDQIKLWAERIYQLEQHVTLFPAQEKVKQAVFGQGFKKIFCRKGRKAGGTEMLFYVAARVVGTQRNKLGYLVYPDSPSADRILHQTNRIRTFFPKEWGAKVTWTDKKREVYFPGLESRIVILGAHQWESMQGFEFDFCGFDELADHDPRAYQYCYPNVAARDAVWMVIGAPPLSKHNFYNKIETEALTSPAVWSHNKWNLYENTFLPETFDLEQERIQHELRGDWDIWEVQWLANYITGGPRTVLKAFDPGHHILPHKEIMERIHASNCNFVDSFDPGYATCFSVVFSAYDVASRSVYLYAEIYEKDRLKISARKIWERRNNILHESNTLRSQRKNIYDSAATGFASEIRDLEENKGVSVPMLPTAKQKGDEDKYFRMINDLCLEGRLYISNACSATIFEVENYITDEQGRYPDKDNHALDNMRYLTKYLEKQFAGFKPGMVSEAFRRPKTEVEVLKEESIGISKPAIEDWPFLH